jgi:LacI family transcriptional regulator
MATIRDVAKLAGFSIATVSRVINKIGYVHKNTEEAVNKAMATLNFRPNEMARGLAGKNTRTIALIMPDIINPFFPEIARAVEDTAVEQGYTVILCNSDNNQEKERKYFNVLEKKQIDGLIIASYTIQAEQILELESKSIPVVVIDNSFPGHPILSLIPKNRQGAKMAVQHLLDQDCRKIGHIGGPYSIYAARERYLGYEDVASKQAWFTPSLVVQSDFHINGGYKAMLELLSRHPDMDGVFAGNDLMAVGAMKAIKHLGIQIPNQIKLMGFDGISLDFVVPELSTIAQPIYKIGSEAMNYLIQLIEGAVVDKTTYELDVELLIRQSTKNTEGGASL